MMVDKEESSSSSDKQTTWYIGPVEDSLQFFKEDTVEDAVYAIYLKKVRYHTPDDSTTSVDDDRQARLQWRLEEVKVIKQGSLHKLVEALSSPTGEVEATYVNVFLSTYRSFASPKQVLNLLLERYRNVGEDTKLRRSSKEGHQKTIKTVISLWMDSYTEDFREPPNFPCLQQVVNFAAKYLPESDLANRAKSKIKKFSEDDEPTDVISVDDVEQYFIYELLKDVPPHRSSFHEILDFDSISAKDFADQLTFIDAQLFKKVVPHHCLGCIWSRRDKKGRQAPSVYATVNQFNAVSYRVIAQILKFPYMHAMDRAKIIQKWIAIAQELRVLKNFSSLKAIVSGLQSNPVYRLKKTWEFVERESQEMFDELSSIFSEENNQMFSRELLMKEGTAKFADPESMNTIRGHNRRKSNSFGTLSKRKSVNFDAQPQIMQGTIPYLGTFLTDLTMIDSAIPDTSESGLINFEKKRKEFEILAQIRLLQSACNLYRISPSRSFLEWFYSIRVYDDNESYELSCEIENPSVMTIKEKGHHKKPSETSLQNIGLLFSSLGFFAPRRPASVEDLTDSMSTLVMEDQESIYSNPEPDMPISGPRPHLFHSKSTSSMNSIDSVDIQTSPWKCTETCVVKVFMDTPDRHKTDIHYKSIMLANSDHTKTVISNILLKFNIDCQPADFVICQILPDREMEIPEKGNVFYAINNNVPELKFVIRKKSDLEKLKSRHIRGKNKRKKFTL